MTRVTGLAVLAALTASAQTHLTYLDLGTQGRACCMVTDAHGNVYTAGSLIADHASKIVASKIDPAGNLVYRLVFGGSSLDTPRGLAVDPNGDLFIAGATTSTDFPLLNPLNRNAPRVLERGFLSKLDPTGTRLLFSTFIGGTQSDADTSVDALTQDQAGNVYLTGGTGAGPDFPVHARRFCKNRKRVRHEGDECRRSNRPFDIPRMGSRHSSNCRGWSRPDHGSRLLCSDSV